MKLLERIFLYGCALAIVGCSVSTAIQANKVTGIQQDRLAVDTAVKAAQKEMMYAQAEQYKALIKQIKAEEDRANAQTQELTLLKLEVDQLKRSRDGIMALYDILRVKVKK